MPARSPDVPDSAAVGKGGRRERRREKLRREEGGARERAAERRVRMRLCRRSWGSGAEMWKEVEGYGRTRRNRRNREQLGMCCGGRRSCGVRREELGGIAPCGSLGAGGWDLRQGVGNMRPGKAESGPGRKGGEGRAGSAWSWGLRGARESGGAGEAKYFLWNLNLMEKL